MTIRLDDVTKANFERDIKNWAQAGFNTHSSFQSKCEESHVTVFW